MKRHGVCSNDELGNHMHESVMIHKISNRGTDKSCVGCVLAKKSTTCAHLFPHSLSAESELHTGIINSGSILPGTKT